jgi:hypothetical protein
MSKKNYVFFFSLFIDLCHRAMKKIHSYENFVPYYYQFIQQLIDLLGRILFFLFLLLNIFIF